MTNKSCATPSAAGNTALKIDTSGLASTLQKMAEAQMAEQMQQIRDNAAKGQAVNPIATIAEVSGRMTELYGRYEKLQEIGKLLNGVGLSDPIPEELAIEEIVITFRTKTGGSKDYSPQKIATVKNVICAGDIYKLLSGEMGILILTLEQEMKSLLEVTQRSDAQYEKARKQWETSNPDRQIKPIAPAPTT